MGGIHIYDLQDALDDAAESNGTTLVDLSGNDLNEGRIAVRHHLVTGTNIDVVGMVNLCDCNEQEAVLTLVKGSAPLFVTSI